MFIQTIVGLNVCEIQNIVGWVKTIFSEFVTHHCLDDPL